MSSGLFPSGDRVVVLPDPVDDEKESVIHIPDAVKEKHAMAQSTGTLIAVGPDAFRHSTSITERLIDGHWKPVERTITGYSEPFASVGDRVAFAKYGGLEVEGEDGQKYRIMNDEDITCRVSDAVNFTDLKTRKRLSDG